jgi:hypothetical protein
MAPGELADEFARLADGYREVARDLDLVRIHASAHHLDRARCHFRLLGRDLVLSLGHGRDLGLNHVVALSRDIGRGRDLVLGLELALGLAPGLGRILALVRGRVHVVDKFLDRALGLDRDLHLGRQILDLVLDRRIGVNRDLAFGGDLVIELANRLEAEVPLLRADGQQGNPTRGRDHRVEARILNCMARPLPGTGRSRFVAEAQGNLGDCEHWWQRVDHLVGLAFGMTRLAWMMRRDGRRGRV